MKELLERMEREHGISEEKSRAILDTIKDYIKEKFPMVSGVVDNLFQINDDGPAPRPDPSKGQSRQDDFLD